MRTIYGAQSTDLAAHHRSTHVRVFVDRLGVGTFLDLTDANSIDWVDAVEIQVGIDKPCASATVTLKRESDGDSVATLVENSAINQLSGTYVAAIDAGREFYIEACVLGPTDTPAAPDWVELFRGRIDSVEFGSAGSLKITGRDQAGDLVSGWVETTGTYGTLAGRAAESVMQDILDDHTSGTTLYSPNGTGITPFNPSDSPGFNIITYNQTKQNIYEALDAVVRNFGWVLEHRWQVNTGSFELQLVEPDRTKTTPDRTFDDSDYFSIDRLSISRQGVRNAIRLIYSNYFTGDRKDVVRTDASSITRYGRLFMEVAESSSSQIDTLSEATDMADAMLADLKSPSAEKSVKMPLFWPVELGDLYRFSANNVHYDTDMDLAVVGLKHTFSSKQSTTVLALRGSPSAGYMRWLGLTADLYPALGESCVRAEETSTLDLRDMVNVNPTFSELSKVADIAPDGWVADGENYATGTMALYTIYGDWGTDLEVDDTEYILGKRSVKFSSDAKIGALNAIPLNTMRPIGVSDGLYEVRYAYKYSGTITGQTRFFPRMIGYDRDGAYLSSKNMDYSSGSGWIETKDYFIINNTNPWAVANEVYSWSFIRPEPMFWWDATDAPISMHLDHFMILQVKPISHTISFTAQPVTPSTWTTAIIVTPIVGGGHTGLIDSAYKRYAPSAGQYSLHGSIALSSMLAGKTLSVRIQKNGTTVLKTHTITSVQGINIIQLRLEGLPMLSGDYLEFQVYHTDAASRSNVVNDDLTYVIFRGD